MLRIFLLFIAAVSISGCSKDDDTAVEPSETAPKVTVSSYAKKCDYFNAKDSKSYTGECLETWFEDGSHEIVGGGYTFKFPSDDKNQGQWTTTKINGNPAVKYEIQRGRHSYATLDLNEFLETE